MGNSEGPSSRDPKQEYPKRRMERSAAAEDAARRGGAPKRNEVKKPVGIYWRLRAGGSEQNRL